ncbi:MAG: methyltransferase [Alphaproteobacteria bacterium]
MGRPETTIDRLLGGRLRVEQPRHGYRTGADSVLLAAAGTGGKVLDVGAGVGTVGLCLAKRLADARVTLLERDAEAAALARDNAAANDLAGRVEVVAGDLRERPVPMHHFDSVVTNPPYFAAHSSPGATDAARRAARTEAEVPLADWLRFCVAALRPGGTLTLVHRMERLPAILAALEGGVTVFPLWPRAGKPSKTVLVRKVKDSNARLTMRPGLVLHEADGRNTVAADAVLRGGASLDL